MVVSTLGLVREEQENIMLTTTIVRLVIVIVGLGACGHRAEDLVPNNDSPAVTTTVAPREQLPNECGKRIPRIDSPVYC